MWPCRCGHGSCQPGRTSSRKTQKPEPESCTAGPPERCTSPTGVEQVGACHVALLGLARAHRSQMALPECVEGVANKANVCYVLCADFIVDFTSVTALGNGVYNVALVRNPYATVYAGDITAVRVLYPSPPRLCQYAVACLPGVQHLPTFISESTARLCQRQTTAQSLLLHGLPEVLDAIACIGQIQYLSWEAL